MGVTKCKLAALWICLVIYNWFIGINEYPHESSKKISIAKTFVDLAGNAALVKTVWGSDLFYFVFPWSPAFESTTRLLLKQYTFSSIFFSKNYLIIHINKTINYIPTIAAMKISNLKQ